MISAKKRNNVEKSLVVIFYIRKEHSRLPFLILPLVNYFPPVAVCFGFLMNFHPKIQVCTKPLEIAKIVASVFRVKLKWTRVVQSVGPLS